MITEPIRFGSQAGCGWQIVCSAVGMNVASMLRGRDLYLCIEIMRDKLECTDFIAALTAERYKAVCGGDLTKACNSASRALLL